MKVSKLILLHIIAWLSLSVVFLFSAEWLMKLVTGGYTELELWGLFVIVGWLVIFLLTLVSLIIMLVRKKASAKSGGITPLN